MEALSAPPPSSSLNDSLEAKTEEPIEDETNSSTEHEIRKQNEETNNNTKSSKRNKNSASSKPAEKTTGNYNRYFLSNFKIENIFSFQKRHDVRLSQDKVGLILSDPSAFEKLQEFLRQEGCVTDGTLRVNYNDLLRTRLHEIEEHNDESKDSDDDLLAVPREEMVSRPFRRERRPRMIPESDANSAISEPIPTPTLPDFECTTPAKESRLQITEEEDGNSDSSLPITSDQATKSTASSSPTSVMDMMDLDMKGIDQVVDTFEVYEEEHLSGKKDASDDDDDDEFVEDDSSVDSGLFVENRTFSRPAASAPVAARPWGPDSAPNKKEKIWDVCAVEAPATTMDFDHLWEDDDNSEVDLYPYRQNAYDYSSDEDVYNDATPPSKKDHSKPTGSPNEESWQSQSARGDGIEFSVDAREPITHIDEQQGPRVRFSSKKEFHYPSPGHDTSANEGSDVTHDIDFQMTSEEMQQRKSVSLPKKRISRRQKRHHVVETLEI
ncbi:hypothetical protein FisN_26Lh035 [Fistulifera solaris]|uniref:Uncharacterized protein n=1 Tax=Fistulifera solaris TaxID=1519565 RepID=A0A1Z5KCP7_FISSO|nr:hypothetical protein FisN_26Lh035 [Fistulifera solaris]|eukprot:GAX23976.1 hypothetical protein FisN_26Lh035 [Fistulifera solaris]